MAVGFNSNKFVKDSKEYVNHSVDKPIEPMATSVDKKPRKKRVSKTIDNKTIVPAQQDTDLNLLQSDISYMTAYDDTNKQLDGSIKELNLLGGELMDELMTVKSSKTLRNKYNIMNDMTGTITNIINTKVSIIKEKNKTINDVNNMNLKRMKELKLDSSKEDDNTKIMNLYDAFINTPVGDGRALLGPSISDMTLMGGGPSPTSMVPIGSDQAQWEQNLDPAQNRMLLEAKGAVETVVFYDEASGNRWYEVVDINTKQPIPNIEKPDNSYIYDLDINRQGGYARDNNRNVTYPLIIVNGDASIMDY